MDRLATMEIFIRAVDSGSFSGAAKQLHIGQPAVSKAIAQLEDRLGVRLLLRSTRGLTPTEAGRNYYNRAKRSVEEAEEAELAARGAAATLSGRLRFCAPVSFARLHVMPRLPAFLAEHPSIDIDLCLEDRDIDLVAAGIDVALLIGRLADAAVTARKIGECQRHVIATPGYFAAKGVPRTPADLIAHEIIVYEQRDGGTTWTFRQGTSQASITMNGRLRVSAGEGVRAAVLAGVGLAVASEWLFAPELESGAVVSVLQDWLLPPVDLWAVFPAGRQVSAKARAFASFIQTAVSNSGAAKERPQAAGLEDRKLLSAVGGASKSSSRVDHLAAAA
ncbi:MAG TPA: LysR family transcriptional regulator [Stellaceae bacterium]|nr:LysR family transcriptional regulator [Stellaceae bacterium]